LYISEEKPVIGAKDEIATGDIAVWKITALWAFSEAALGGILHAFKIPFRGVFVGGSAAILISLIAYFSNRRGTIIKSTLLVILIKGLVSPHSPVTAYFAVFIQGMLGELLFYSKHFFKISSLLLGILTLIYSSVQKIFILTIVFGNTLWESIDEFLGFIVNKFVSGENTVNIKMSYVIVGLYIGLHVFAGFFVGLFAGRLPLNIAKVGNAEFINLEILKDSIVEFELNKKLKRKRWWRRPSGILLFAFAGTMVILSYIYPEPGNNKAAEIGIMLLRAIVIMILWYTVLAPILLKFFRKYIKKKQNSYSTEITRILESFPRLRILISHSWKISSNEKGLKKIKTFIVYLLSTILLMDTGQ
jgi:hypothetical protein